MGMESGPKYEPTPEEMKEAEDSMTPAQIEATKYREHAFSSLKKLFENEKISPENLRDIDLKKTKTARANQDDGTYRSGYNELVGEVNGHKVSIREMLKGEQSYQGATFEGEVDGQKLREEKAREIYFKYRTTAEYLTEYNNRLQRSRENIKKELEMLDEEKRLGAILKDIL